jgi:hypothetical protein
MVEGGIRALMAQVAAEILVPVLSSKITSSFVETRCQTCKAGWTRQAKDGGVVVICLIDREPAWPQMVSCDRYELK